MAKIFLSHSAPNSSEAIAVRDWLIEQGWSDLFLDLDPERGLKAGQRWQDALKRAAERCEFVLCLISPEWCASKWCLLELMLARNLNKRIFGVVVSPTPFSDLPIEITGEWQIVDLTAGHRDWNVTVESDSGDRKGRVSFSRSGLERLRIGLAAAGLEARYFRWPPSDDPNRSPYRGLRPLEAEDAGIFFGRDALLIKAIDALRGLRDAPTRRIFVILGASGAGKSSFLRAGILPRLTREDRSFLPLPVIRPERAVLYGEEGLLRALENICHDSNLQLARADLRHAVSGGAETLIPVLKQIIERTATDTDGVPRHRPPTIVISVDQGEELFRKEGLDQSQSFLTLLRGLVTDDELDVLVQFTIRSDNYEHLQVAPELEGLEQETFGLPPMPKGSYAYVIKGPVQRLEGQANEFKMDDDLVEALLTDIEAGVAGDVLPLLAFTLERLYQEYHATGVLKLEHYLALGQVKGSIEAAVEAAFKAANNDQNIPVAHQSRLELLRRGLIPHLASIDADTGAPVRKVSRLSDIPEASRPLLNLLVEQRLLSTDVSMKTGETTIEPVHEALLRQWSLLKSWLAEDALQLRLLEGVRRASRDWIARDRAVDWLIHRNERLEGAERLIANTDLTGALDFLDRDYLYACRKVERAAISRQRRLYTIIASLALTLSAGLMAWANRAVVESSSYRLFNFWPYVLSSTNESRLNPLDTFRECATGCPEMVVVPQGQFLMGSEPNEPGREHDEGPKHNVVIPRRFAVSKFPITFDEWEACARHGPCAKEIRDYGWGRGRRPVISINWNDAKVYVRWLSTQTGKTYRLLSEAEWEYLARTGNNDRFDLSQFSGTGKANCKGCGSRWDSLKTAPVGSFPPNAWGLYDLQGNVWQWVEDCWQSGYQNAPNDSTPVESADCARRIMRGGAWNFDIRGLRPAFRYANPPVSRDGSFGFRVARDLSH